LRFLSELKSFIRFPTISSHKRHAGDMQDCATWLSDHLKQIGMDRAWVVSTPRHPIVYSESRGALEKATVLIYGHYDVQPVDPLAEWRSPPFEPAVRGENLYGRGASDDKGQLFAHVKAIEACLQSWGSLPVNILCIFEGEEEIGSPNLADFLAANREFLRSDIAVISDTPILSPARPAITYSLRGNLNLELEVYGPRRDLHSGQFGGVVHNPLQVLSEIISNLHDNDNRIAVPGFYDRVQHWDRSEREYMRLNGPSAAKIRRDAGVRRSWGERGFSLYECRTIRPALTINGISGGYQGPGSKGVIPSTAAVKLGLRLVPDQNPAEIARLFRRYITSITPSTVRTVIRELSAAKPALVDRSHPAMRAAEIAYARGFGTPPVFLRSGGTIPVVNILQELLGIPTVLMGFALPDDRMHAPNEKFHLPNFYNGIATSIWFLNEAGKLPMPASARLDSRLEIVLTGTAE
jgi:acetylornithine deacetylase/succinyl-diaminopimelate desuccinylase-like protein